MLLHEIFSLFESIDQLISEGFKDDMFKQYPEDVENKDFKAAIASYNSDPKLKEALKHAVKPQGNIAVSIKKQCPTGADFIKLIDSLIKNAKDKQEYKQLKQGTVSAGETDYWMIPCHTFDEVHEAAFKYTGNLPRLSKEEISKKYGINIPKSATHYETEKSPEEFLEYMKNEDRFFMAPSWCIAGSEKGQGYFDSYHLKTSKDEKPLCYVFISKKYPNVRFCVTLKKDNEEKEIDTRNEKIKFTTRIDLGEVRDPWQIGGTGDTVGTGSKMMELAFGLKIRRVLEDISDFIMMKTIPFSEIKDGSQFFYKSTDTPSISGSFDSLVSAFDMFLYSNIKKVNCKFPALENASHMFFGSSLIEFTASLPKLIEAKHMFSRCEKLKKFECNDLSKLKNGSCMFINCRSLMSFSNDLPSLNDGSYMFSHCKKLTSFRGDLSLLEDGTYMFNDCKNLTRFEGDLSLLKYAERMFEGCRLDAESIKNIAETISDAPYPYSTITIGVDEMDEEKEKYIDMIEEKGWKVEIK